MNIPISLVKRLIGAAWRGLKWAELAQGVNALHAARDAATIRNAIADAEREIAAQRATGEINANHRRAR